MSWRSLLLLPLLLLLAGCRAGEPRAAAIPTVAPALPATPPTANEAVAGPAHIPIPEYPGVNRRIDDPNEYFYEALIPRDGIRPVYEPEFGPASSVELAPEELVMGVAWGGEARAYPVTVMRFREMVNDELAGIPILVTW